jgi:hypothetical protein
MKTPISQTRRQRPTGFTLLEALLLVSILGIVAAGIGSALRAVTHVPTENNSTLLAETALLEKMEYLRSLPFATLAADVGRSPSNFTDSPIINGTATPRTVSIVHVVPATSAVSFASTHMLRITVTIDVRSFVCLVNEP